jgi:hypothetical protein
MTTCSSYAGAKTRNRDVDPETQGSTAPRCASKGTPTLGFPRGYFKQTFGGGRRGSSCQGTSEKKHLGPRDERTIR